MGLEDVGDLALHIILLKLGPKESAIVACVSKKLRSSASEESLWSKFCFEDLDLSDPLDPLANPAPSFKVTYQIWRGGFAMYPWPLVKRVKRCWSRLKDWMRINFPEMEGTLREGASEAKIQEFENHIKVKLPLPTRILYRFHDGQEISTKAYTPNFCGNLLGLVGGYSFYDYRVNVYLLPLNQVIASTSVIMRKLHSSLTPKCVVVALSFTNSQKAFFLNCSTGQLFVGSRSLTIDGDMMPCVPNGLINSVHEFNGDNQQDAMLLWLEEHGRRLESGIIKVRDEDNIRSISLFPEEPPLCSTAITHGVKVRASSVFVPELTNDPGDSAKYYFSYSIRMSLQPEGCIINGVSFGSCQLHWRRWIIRANDVVITDFNAEAVIGKYPLLHPGDEEFVYESCSNLESSVGSIEGSFTFVPGRLADPKGTPFEAAVARFPLQVPDYIF